MKFPRYLVITILCSLSSGVAAQPTGEANEPTLEELDAAFTEADAAREQARWSDVKIAPADADPLGSVTAAADIVIAARVKSQQVIYDSNDLPFTHTTFEISEVFSGSYSSPEITFIQEGGPVKDDPVNVIMVSDARYFGVAEEEILFLKLDPDNAVAERRIGIDLRFRVLEGKVYDEDGRGILLKTTSDGTGHRLGVSRDRNPAPRFNTIQIGPHTLSKNFSGESEFPDSGGGSDMQRKSTAPAYQSSVDVTTFRAAITGQ